MLIANTEQMGFLLSMWPNGTRKMLLFCATVLTAISGFGAELEEARQQFVSGQYSNCANTCRGAISNYVYQEEWHELLTRSEFAQGRYEAAGAAMSNALQRFTWSIPLKLLAYEVFPYTSQSNRSPQMIEQIEGSLSGRIDFRYRDAASVVAIGRAALLLGADPRKILDQLFEPARKQAPELREPYLAIGDLALDKHDYALAARQFAAALKKFPEDPEIHFGLARAYQPSDRKLMLEHADKALKANTNHAGSLLLMADHLIDAEDYDEADKLLGRVLKVNPWHPEAWAYRAILHNLRNDAAAENIARTNALMFHRSNARVEYLIGRKLSQKYRFVEGAACQRQALAMQANYTTAKGQLAQDLLRLGQDAEGWKLAEEAHKEDEYDVTLFNLVTLKDKMRRFATITNDAFIVRMATNEAPVYGQDALALLSQARSNLTSKFGITLAQPTVVEIFPEQKDFGVRTFGMPDNPGFLGVCFGPVITANSPAAQVSHAANWHAVLWHEFTHVITLQMTRNKMPRWLSEGISVFEELQYNPSWGQRMTARYREMVLDGELSTIEDLSSAFLAPKTPMHLQFAYYESSLVVEFIVQQFGFPALTLILKDLGEGVNINKSIAARTAPMEKLEKDFEEFARGRAKALGPKVDWQKPSPADLRSQSWLGSNPNNYWGLQRQARELVAAKKWKEARELCARFVDLEPTQTGADSAWLLLAEAERGLGNTNGEQRALTQLASLDGEAVDAFRRLIEIGEATGNWRLVQENADRLLQVNPLIPQPHRALAIASDKLGHDELAARENRVLLELDPPNPSEAHFNLARSLHRMGQDDSARRHVLMALEEAPRFRDAHQLLLELQGKNPAGETPESHTAPLLR